MPFSVNITFPARRIDTGPVVRVACWAWVLLGLVAMVVPPAAAQPEAQRPNILWISVEDMGPRLGAYGDEVARTANIDALAGEGVRFTNAFTTAGVCAPSRSAIITGMYQNSIGTHHMRTSIEAPGLPTPYEAVPPPYVKTFTESLRAAGYYTTNNVKTDYQFDTPSTAWDESSRQAHWRNRPDDDQPFFSVFNLTATHESEAWAAKNEGEALQTDPSTVEVPPYYPDTPAVRRHIARQYDNIAEVDDKVGQLLQQLEDDGLADETIVFFWSDHGDGLPRAKRWIYDSGIHVPLIVRRPGGGEAGRVNDELVSFVDLAPTVLELAGIDPPVHMQGQAFMGADPAPRDYVFAARDRFDQSYDMIRAARSTRYKYIRNYYPNQPYVLHLPYRNRNATMQALLERKAEGTLEGAQALWMRDKRPPEELYDVQADPHEVKNLADDPAYQDVLDRMSAATDAWMDRIDDKGAVPEDAMVEQMWPGGEQPTTADPIPLPRHSTKGPLPQRDTFTVSMPMEVTIYDGTHGASIGYTTEEGTNANWTLYSGPITIEETTTIRARAIRYGYKPSDEVTVTFQRNEQ